MKDLRWLSKSCRTAKGNTILLEKAGVRTMGRAGMWLGLILVHSVEGIEDRA